MLLVDAARTAAEKPLKEYTMKKDAKQWEEIPKRIIQKRGNQYMEKMPTVICIVFFRGKYYTDIVIKIGTLRECYLEESV